MEGDTSSLMFEDTDGLAYSQFISSNFDESSNQGYEVDETNTIDLASSEVRFGSAPVVKRKCLSVPRRLFPLEVVTHLESLFDMDKYIKESQIEEICKITSLNEKQIRSWFKQRRFRYNLENKEKGKYNVQEFSIDFRNLFLVDRLFLDKKILDFYFHFKLSILFFKKIIKIMR